MALLANVHAKASADHAALGKLTRVQPSPGAGSEVDDSGTSFKAMSEEERARINETAILQGNGRYQEFIQEMATLAGTGDDVVEEDEDVVCTQAEFDPTCPITKQLLARPVKAVPCFRVGAKRCVFTKVAIEQHLRNGPRPCPFTGCSYKGNLSLSDLEPCHDTERKLKRHLAKEKRRQQDEDALDEDEGLTQIDI